MSEARGATRRARGDRVGALLEEARERITRYEPAEAAEVMRRGGILVDVRPTEYRWRFGEVPGAIAVSRHVLEWRLDVTSEHRLKELEYGDRDRAIVLMCN
jgi:rhodanese-related sulfurtransferase